MEDQKESVVGRKLTEFTTKKVILLVLTMLFVSPIFSVDQYIESPIYFQYGLRTVAKLGGSSTEAGKINFDNMV